MRCRILLVILASLVALSDPDCAETEIGCTVAVYSVAIEWSADIGTTYQVFLSDDLADWSVLGQPILADSEKMFLVDQVYGIERRFYKVGTVLPEFWTPTGETRAFSKDSPASVPPLPEQSLPDIRTAPAVSVHLEGGFECGIALHSVAIEWSAGRGDRYQVYVSRDLTSWAQLGGPVRADRANMQVLHEVYGLEERFFKVHELHGTPDLVVRDVWIEPWPLTQGQPFRIGALVENKGDGTVLEGWVVWSLPHFWVRCSFEIDGAIVGDGQVDFYQGSSDLDPGQSVVIRSPLLTMSLPTAGCVVAANADDRAVSESDEYNNRLSRFYPSPFFTLCLTLQGCGQVKVNGVLHGLPYCEQFPPGEVVELEAVPCVGARFVRWEGPVAPDVSPITIVMNHDFDITAVFDAFYPCRLYLAKQGDGNGYVRVNGVLRTLPWTGLFTVGSSLTLQAVPDPYSRFLRWWGDPPAEVVFPEWIWQNPLRDYLLDRDKSLTVHFENVWAPE